jgi:protein-S-isoprenylcysteine O-methyltransferase Ste14
VTIDEAARLEAREAEKRVMATWREISGAAAACAGFCFALVAFAMAGWLPLPAYVAGACLSAVWLALVLVWVALNTRREKAARRALVKAYYGEDE